MELRSSWERFTAGQVGIVAVGQGSVAKTKAFRAQLDLPFPLLADPRRVSYTAYDLLRMELRREASLDRLKHTVKATLTHGAALSTDQDMRLLGGMFVVDPAGIVRFAHRSARVDDVPDPNMVLELASRSGAV